MNLTELLTRRLGPLPAWVYLVGVAGLGFLAYRMHLFGAGQGQAAPTQPAGAQPALTPLQEAGLLQQLAQLPQSQQTAGPAAAAPAAPTDSPVNPSDWVPFGSSFWYKPGGQDAPFVKGGRTYFHLVDPAALQAYKQAGGQPYFFPQPGFPVPGETGAVYGVAPVGGADVGGPKVPRPHHSSLLGGRSQVGVTSSLWRPGHPLLRSGDQLHPHFALGGAGAGGNVHAAAAATGLHPARLLALNPHLRAGRPHGNQYLRIR